MTIIDRTFISIIVKIKKITIKISIRELRSKIYHFDEYIVLIFYIESILSKDIYAFV